MLNIPKILLVSLLAGSFFSSPAYPLDVKAGEAGAYPGSPEGVVEKFCILDAKGKRLRPDTAGEILALVSWDDPESDVTNVISEFKVGKARVTGEKAAVPVTYRILGSTDSFTFSPAVQKTRAVTYELSKKDGLWRIDGPVTLPHVFGEDVVAVLTRGIERVRPERRKKLEAVIQHIRRASETP